MKRDDAIKIILNNLEDKDIALFTTGMISRTAFYIKDRPSNFYLIGSMGLASSVALGLALNTDRKVFVFDGDGSILMDMGAMAMIAVEAPGNLVHIVLDNEAYQSTGNQPSISHSIDLSSVAKSLGYPYAHKIYEKEELERALPYVKSLNCPSFLLLKIEFEELRGLARIPIPPEELTARLKNRFNVLQHEA